VREALADAGLDLTGDLTVADYDGAVPEPWRAESVLPGCRGVRVVGNAGPGLWERFRASPESRLRRDPLDAYVTRVLRECVRTPFADYGTRRAGVYAPLVDLAARAGLGAPSRLGLLVHPVYGPWISLRALVFLDEEPQPADTTDFDPCTHCPAPCVDACRGSAIGPGSFDGLRCLRTKLVDGACRSACDARHACVIGREHAFVAEAIAHHSRLHWTPCLALHAVRALTRG